MCKLRKRKGKKHKTEILHFCAEIIEVSWLPVILGAAAAVVMATVVVGFIWWRYGHRLSFWCRTLPDRGQCSAHSPTGRSQLLLNPFTVPACNISRLNYARTCLQTLYFSCPITSIFSAICFDENPFHMPVRKRPPKKGLK